jgi:hypothetical protein
VQRFAAIQGKGLTDTRSVDQTPARHARIKCLGFTITPCIVLSGRNRWTAHLTAVRGCHPLFSKNLASSRCPNFRHSEVLWSFSHIRAHIRARHDTMCQFESILGHKIASMAITVGLRHAKYPVNSRLPGSKPFKLFLHILRCRLGDIRVVWLY